MAELDTLKITNPMKEEFQVRFNGELYTIKAGETSDKPQFLALHMAKHLSDYLVQEATAKKFKKKVLTSQEEVKKVQIEMHDNPERRKALYTILESKENVERVILAYPQFKGFVGDMAIYDDFVEKYNKTVEPETKVEAKVGTKVETKKEA